MKSPTACGALFSARATPQPSQNPRGTLVEPWWNCGGTLVEPSWINTPPEPIWAHRPQSFQLLGKKKGRKEKNHPKNHNPPTQRKNPPKRNPRPPQKKPTSPREGASSRAGAPRGSAPGNAPGVPEGEVQEGHGLLGLGILGAFSRSIGPPGGDMGVWVKPQARSLQGTADSSQPPKCTKGFVDLAKVAIEFLTSNVDGPKVATLSGGLELDKASSLSNPRGVEFALGF